MVTIRYAVLLVSIILQNTEKIEALNAPSWHQGTGDFTEYRVTYSHLIESQKCLLCYTLFFKRF